MALLQPTRREFLAYGSAAVAAAARTAPLDLGSGRPLQFLVVGDWGRDGANFQRQVAAAMKSFADTASFVVSTGDNFYKLGVSSVQDSQWDSSFERIYDESLDCWYAVLGNHDYGGNVDAQIERTCKSDRWNMPDYWHDRLFSDQRLGDVHLFFVNTVVWLGREDFPYRWLGSPIRPGDQQRQVQCIRDKLQQSNARWKFVFGHHGIYSIAKHGGTYRLRQLDELLQGYGVAAYVNGHDHCMYHITAPAGDDTRLHYICSGAGSEMLPHYRGGEAVAGCVFNEDCAAGVQLPGRALWHSFRATSHVPDYALKGGFAVFDVGAYRTRVRFIEPLGLDGRWQPVYDFELGPRVRTAPTAAIRSTAAFA